MGELTLVNKESMQSTYGQLNQLFEEYREKMNGLDGILHRSKLNDFMKKNQIRIKGMHESMKKIQTEHFVIEDDKIKYEGEGKDRKAIYQEGKDKEGYTKEMQTLFETEVFINV